MLVLVFAAPALGGELTFAPDRPGVGDSTDTPGPGRGTVELGLAAALGPDGSTVGTSGIIGRIGVDRGLELRLRAPDVTFGGEAVGVGTVGVGAKIGGPVSSRWSVSLVPELSVDPTSGQIGGSLNGNVGLVLGGGGLWAHASTSGSGGALSLLVGGGASVTVGRGGVFVNGGHTVGGPTFAGVGGWWLLQEALQADLTVDVVPSGAAWTWLPSAGLAFGF